MKGETEGHLEKIIHLTQSMLALAEQGEAECRNESCGIISAILRDNAYRLRQLAETEQRLQRCCCPDDDAVSH